MRKIGQIFRFLIPAIALAVLVVFMTGAGRRRKARAVYEAKVEGVMKAWETGQVNQFHKYYHPDFVVHSPGSPFGDEDLEAIKKRALSDQELCSDIDLTAEQLILEGDYGVVRWTWRATYKATGKELIVKGCTVDHMVDGKAKEAWEYTDWLGLLQQIGFKLVPPGE